MKGLNTFVSFFQMKLILQCFWKEVNSIQVFGTFDQRMRKVHQLHVQSKFLPSIVQTTSRKELQKNHPYQLKENDNLGIQLIQKIKKEQSQHYAPRKNNFKKCPILLEDVLDRKLAEKLKTDIPTQPKMNQPWIAKEIDPNKETTRKTRIISQRPFSKVILPVRRKSCQGTPESSITEQRLNTFEDETINIPKKTMSRIVSMGRDKIYSCKIAMKRGVFPMSSKKVQQQKLIDFFEQVSQISAIQDLEQKGEQNLFMSLESYMQMNL